MHVALIYDAVYPYVAGGVERRYHAFAAAEGRAHHVVLYGLNYWRRDPSGRVPYASYVGVAPAVPLYDRKGRRTLLEPFLFAFGLFWALLRSREDVWDVASFPYISVPVARVLSAVKRRPMVVTWIEHWGDYWYEYLGVLGVVGKLFEWLALRCSPRIIAISAFTKGRLVAAGVAEDRIAIVPNGVDVPRIDAAPTSPEPFDLVYVGRLVAPKQVHLLLESMPHLRARRPDATLLVVGDGPERRNLERLAETLGLAGAVRFTGHLGSPEEVYARLKAGRVFVLPSRREGFGTVVIEAWAAGLPVVVCDEPENAAKDLIDAPAKGRVVKPTAPAIAAACAELLAADSPVARAALRREAARYDWPVITAQLVAAYAAAVTPAAGRAPRTP